MAAAEPSGRTASVGRLLRLATVTCLAAAIAACAAGPPAPTLAVPSGALIVRAVDTTFQPAQLTAPAGGGFVLYFDNADALLHNVVVRSADGTAVLQGDVFSGPAQRVYDMPAMASGTYTLHCDVHPEMNGTLTVP